MNLGKGVAAVMATGVCLVAVAAMADAAELVPHRAAYVMNLNSAKPSSGVAGATGHMTYEFADSCDGWTVENKTSLNFVYTEGGQIATTWDFLTWESKDGLRYRFHVRSTRNGMVTEEIDGTATLTGKDQGGIAKFTLPEPATVNLPKGTLFPSEHTLRLVERAEAGEKFFSRVVFDGSGTDGPFEVSALIGKPISADTPSQGPRSPLTHTPSWRMQMAFFPQESKTEAPDYEVGVRYHANGVAQDVLQNFGDFSIKGTLEKLEPMPKPDC